jgi:hypothetical protein
VFARARWTYKDGGFRTKDEKGKEYTHQVCRSPYCNPGTQLCALLDARTSIHLPLSSSRIWQTTNTQAYASGCIREEIHKHLLSYRGLVANACRLLTDVLVPGGALAVVLGVESFVLMVKYDAMGNEEVRGGTPPESTIGDKFDRLLEGKG